jgi:pimeloyl-ACP methyl ester carboxylesterase
MQTAIEAAGFATQNLGYDSRRKPLQSLAEDIHPAIQRFAHDLDGSVHFVGHSMGGLLTRAYLARHRPQRLGRVVMLGTPNGGSEIADRLKNFTVYRAYFGPAGQQLMTERDSTTHAILPPANYPVGIIAGDRSIDPISSAFLPKPNDGRVSVENTKLAGMTDHIIVSASHTWLARNQSAIDQTIAFLRGGRFSRPAISSAAPPGR